MTRFLILAIFCALIFGGCSCSDTSDRYPRSDGDRNEPEQPDADNTEENQSPAAPETEETPKSEPEQPAERTEYEPEPEPFRTWTTANGKFSVEARYLTLKNNEVSLEKRDGKIKEVDKDILSTEDRIYVDSTVSRRIRNRPGYQAGYIGSPNEQSRREAKIAAARGNRTGKSRVTADWSYRPDCSTSDAQRAYVASEYFVEDNLVAPSTAKFKGYSKKDVTPLGDGTYLIDSHVDSQNGLGAQVRTNFSTVVNVDEDGKTHVIAGSADK